MMTGGENQIAVREPDGTLRKLLTGWDARLTPTGHLLFSRQEGATWSIAAAPFDVDDGRVTGDVTVLSRDVPVRYATPAAASAAGDVFYIAGSPRSDRRVVIVDRSGAERDLRVPTRRLDSGRPCHPTVFALRSAAGKALDEPSGR